MKIKIKDNASSLYAAHVNCGNELYYNDKWGKILKAIEGNIIEVETKHLFIDQFNTVSIDGVSENGIRIMITYVDYVINDARYSKMKCNYCGKTQDINKKCIKCDKDRYLEVFKKDILDYQQKKN